MIANLYLHKNAFEYNGSDSQEQVTNKLLAFANDMREVVYNSYDDNRFIVASNVPTCEVYTGVSLIDSIAFFLDGDRQGIMYSILANVSEEHNYTMDELRSMARYQSDEEEVYSIVYLNHSSVEKDYSHFIQFDVYEIVYDKSSWITLRRQILGNHPEDPHRFIQECRKCFKDLVFHEHCVESLIDDHYSYLDYIPRKIVYYLTCLNDGFRLIKAKHETNAPDANSILVDFSGCFGLDEPGSIERNPNKKEALTYEFQKTKIVAGETLKMKMLCEPHLKISQPDSNKKFPDINYKTFHPRIYFHFGDDAVENGKILIGSIGEHVA